MRRTTLTALLGLVLPLGMMTAPASAALTCDGKAATIVAKPGVPTRGTPGDDVIVGTGLPDTIDGAAGNDTVCGLAGEDAAEACGLPLPARRTGYAGNAAVAFTAATTSAVVPTCAKSSSKVSSEAS